LKYSIVPPTSNGRGRARGSPRSPRRVGDEARRRIALGRVDDVDQVVRHGGALAALGLAVPMSMPR
jgi:hypothetical protein